MEDRHLIVSSDEANDLKEKIADLINILIDDIRAFANENTVVGNGEFLSALVGSTTELMKIYFDLL
ncbi:MAG: hypothetical protein LKF53_02810 [Solobacterium sp.]|jgi:hypothetical protein|nr:hypothetical protein [Solobacterium sp.]MCH4205310.1 hypothetical protein [Solobacterium sp.]MCH4226903.1 hypothetical protein [Solobacterium sp.]MCH4281663.1 hypothetical protein [Solobacterium sp.]